MESKSLIAGAAGSAKHIDISPLRIGRGQVNRLHEAVLNGDTEAARDLVDLAAYAAFALMQIWNSYDLDILSPDFEKNREPRREMLRAIAGGREAWPLEYHCRKGQRKKTEQMVKQLGLGTATPLKAIGVDDDMMRHLIESLTYTIGMPSADNAQEWVERAMNEIETSEPPGMRLALRDPKTWLHGLADPERQVGKRQKAAYKRLEKWEAEKKAEHKSGKLSIEESDTKAKRARAIENFQVTDAELVFGLKEALTARVKSLTEKRPQIKER